jgi:hypothetical protein
MDEPLLMAYQSIDDQAPQVYYDAEKMFDLVRCLLFVLMPLKG